MRLGVPSGSTMQEQQLIHFRHQTRLMQGARLIPVRVAALLRILAASGIANASLMCIQSVGLLRCKSLVIANQ